MDFEDNQEAEDERRDELMEDDYYAFFNLKRDASPEEITNAYRKCSRIYHPDKHSNPLEKAEAELLFNKTKKAYEVLSDPHKRAIYDSVGMQGLQTEGWEVVQRTRTPQEIREEYEQLARERNERRLHQRTNPKGTLTVNVNATDIFSEYDDTYDDLEEPGFSFPSIEVSGISLSQSIEVPLTLKDRAILSGSVSVNNGRGSGGVSISSRRTISNRSTLECSCFAGNGPGIGGKWYTRITNNLTATLDTSVHFTSLGISPALEGNLSYQLSSQTWASLTWRGGLLNAMTTSVVRTTQAYNAGFNLNISLHNTFVMLYYTKRMLRDELKLKLVLKVGTLGSYFEYGVEKKVTAHTRLSAAVGCGYPTGVVLKFKIMRTSQTYSFPIALCDDLAGAPLFYATVTPLVVYLVVKNLIIDPMVRDQKSRDIERQMEMHRIRIAEKRREARAVINLMQATFSRIRSEEESKKGLVIVKAYYGNCSLHTLTDSEFGDDVIDVTIPLQCLVKDSKLVLYDSAKSQLAGFYDPCVGEDKYLVVQYLFHSLVHETVLSDREPIRIPIHSHRVTT